MSKLCIGLFGTCGDSTWRKNLFIPAYEQLGWKGCDSGSDWKDQQYFNPQLEGDLWDRILAAGGNPAKVEAEHLAEDAVICFPITGETYAAGSLAEVGFSILNAIRLDDRRDFIVLIEPKIDQKLLDANPVAAKESLRARALVLAHLKKQRLSNLYLVPTLQDMLEVSVSLFKAAQVAYPLRQRFNIPCSFP